MTPIANLNTAPTLDQFKAWAREQEESTSWLTASSSDLELYPDTTLRIRSSGRIFKLSLAALRSLGSLLHIPGEFFTETCDGPLRSYVFNHLLSNKGASKPKVALGYKDDQLTRICDRPLLTAPRAPLLACIQNSIPTNVSGEPKVIKHHWNGGFDISVIIETLHCEPRRGDTVAFGVNLTENRLGAIQVQSATYRLVCANGAVIRICSAAEHRLRRPMPHTQREQEFLSKITAFAGEAWRQWEQNAEDLQRLSSVPIFEERFDELRRTLRNAPFFLPAHLADMALRQTLAESQKRMEEPTGYDLWNSLSSLGSHNESLSPTMRYRLRLSAGEIIRQPARTCSACHQLVLK